MRRAVAALSVVFLVTACSEPPQKEIDRAQGAIDAARAAGAERYAAEEFTAATAAMQQAHDAVQQRDYRLALSRAIDANDRALEAARQAADGKARARSEAEAAIGHLSAAIRQLEERLKAAEAARLAPRDVEPARKIHGSAQQALQEANAAVAAANYSAAVTTARGMPDRISAEISSLNERMESRTGRGGRRRR